MKKIPTLFKKYYNEEGIYVKVLPEISEGLEWVLTDKDVIATVKWDGSACAIINGELYKRYDARVKYGKTVPEGAIKCQEEADPITGHLPCWVKCNRDNPADKWHFAAYDYYINRNGVPIDGTYEAVGKHFQSNPYNIDYDYLIKHGDLVIADIEITYEGIYNWLKENEQEGIVFWKDNTPICKIKRRDYELSWSRYKGKDIKEYEETT